MDPVDNIWQVALALVLIIGVVMALGFVAKRFQFNKSGGNGQLNIVDSAYLGPKERLVLVQIADQHVLLGMNPQCPAPQLQQLNRQEFARLTGDYWHRDCISLETKQVAFAWQSSLDLALLRFS